jgi:hypothetical protein
MELLGTIKRKMLRKHYFRVGHATALKVSRNDAGAVVVNDDGSNSTSSNAGDSQ